MSVVRVHGMQGASVLAPWPPLAAGELVPVLARYPALGLVRGVAWHSPRPFAASGLVSCDASQVFVKRHAAAVRSAEDLAEEHRFIAHLRARGAAVPEVLQTAEGETVVSHVGYSYEVHAIAPGEDRYRDAMSYEPFRGVDDAFAAGAALASLHAAAQGFVAPRRATGLLVADFAVFGSASPAAALHERLAREPALARALRGHDIFGDVERVLLPFHARLTPHRQSLAPLWCHNDFHASNLLWNAHGVSCVLDFGLSNLTSAAFDLATALERNSIDWLRLSPSWQDIGRPGLAHALLAGYRAVAGDARDILAAVPLALPLVHVEFALAEIAYFHGVLHDAGAVEHAYTHYLLGHAAWFGSPPGLEFLAAVADAGA
jgi:Ser/Thr protein kinase RdoA (MazF antagonist)